MTLNVGFTGMVSVGISGWASVRGSVDASGSVRVGVTAKVDLRVCIGVGALFQGSQTLDAEKQMCHTYIYYIIYKAE